MTTEQIHKRTKNVTRRFGWWFLKAGDEVWAVEKVVGLQKGEKMKKICKLLVISTRAEPLNAITPGDCIKEGFPYLTPNEFVEMLCNHYGCRPEETVNRIKFGYL